MYIRSWTTILFLVLFVAYIDTQFIDNPPGKEDGCSGGIAYFNWTYISNSTPVVFVEWKMNGARIASEQVISSQPFQPVPAYLGRLTKISNAQIFLRSLSTADSGTYVCEVAYSVGPGNVSNEIELTIYDELDNETEIQKSSEENGMITLKPSFLDSSITYTWQYESNVIGTGFSLAATKDGNYTLCVSEGRANCLNPTVNPCHSIDVRLNGCKYSDVELFLGGFSCFLIEFGITSIIVPIFLLCKMFSKIFGNKKTNKIIIIIVFNLFALIIGFALGFGLKDCNKRDLGLGLGLGFGFIFAIALVLTLYIYHKQCGSKTENEDENRESPPKFNSKKPEDSPKRVGSPASASNIKMESKLKS